MWHPLDDARRQVQTAGNNLNRLANDTATWFENEAELFGRITAKSDGNKTVVTIPELPRFPPEWGDRIKSIVTDLRSSLDYIVHQLAVELGGANPQVRGIGFPISLDRKEYLRRPKGGGQPYRNRMMRRVPEDWKKRIDAHQPFNLSRPDVHPLARLNALANRGKHAVGSTPYLTIETANFIHVFPAKNEMKNITLTEEGRVVDVSMEFMMVRYGTDTLVDSHPKNQPSTSPGNVVTTITFGDAMLTGAEMAHIIRYVAGIVAEFEPAFVEPPSS